MDLVGMSDERLKEQINKFSKKGQNLLNEAAATEQFMKAHKRALLLNNDRDLERRCLFNLGASYIAAGLHARGIDVLKSILQEESAANADPFKGDIIFNIGYGHECAKEFDTAIMYYKTAIAEYRLHSVNPGMMCETLVNLAKVYAAKQDYVQARGFYTEAIAVHQEQNKFKEACQVMIYKVDSMLSDEECGADECKFVLDECRDLALKISRQENKTRVLTEIGMKYTLLSDYKNALTCFDCALEACPIDNKQQIAVTLQNMGAIYNCLRQYQTAIDVHKSAVKIHGELGNRSAQAQCFCSLAYAQSQLGNFQVAGESYLHALQAFKDTGDKYGQWQVHEGLAGICMVRSHHHKAVDHYQQAIKLQADAKNVNMSYQDRLVQKLSHALLLQSKTRSTEDKSSDDEVHEETIDGRVVSEEQLDGPAQHPASQEKFVKILPRKVRRRPRSYKRGRRDYSDDEFRPISQVARGFSSITEGSIPSPEHMRQLRDGGIIDQNTPFYRQLSSSSDSSH
ncbi:unnamed protein product [Clavelina lepadiformis]|uniref:Uncharacterized protein n=1 Tax=Clavelina lepadiformis TaxID=159417 RepID=A0ABP0F8J1_CLALP